MNLSVKQFSFSTLLSMSLLILTVNMALAHGRAIFVEPETVRPGEMVNVRGEGFEADSTVKITVHGHSETLKVARADAAGMFIVKVAIPADMPDGVHMLMAQDETGEMTHFRLTVDSTVAHAPLTYVIGGVSVLLLIAGVVLLRMKGDDTHA